MVKVYLIKLNLLNKDVYKRQTYSTADSRINNKFTSNVKKNSETNCNKKSKNNFYKKH